MSELVDLFGKKIRGLRRSKELTQERLAELAGISLQNIGDIERGKGNPTLETVEKISFALQEDFSSLFDFGGIGLSREQALLELENLLSRATEAQVQMILTVVRVLLQR